MMQLLSCEVVRDRLAEFHDGELALDEQVAIERHLRECVACAIEAEEIASLAQLLREMASRLPEGPTPDASLAAIAVDQACVEARLSLRARVRDLFDDMHLVWPAVGATAAMMLCLLGALGVMQATSREHPDSLAGVIAHLAAAGSNRNPLRLDGGMAVPRALEGTIVPMTEADGVFPLAAVVTREGRIQSLEVLAAEQARTMGVRPEAVLAMLDAASRARFAPAESRGTPVAVSMVWVLAHTTVRGDASRDLLRGGSWVPPGRRPPAPRPSAAAPGPSSRLDRLETTDQLADPVAA